MWSQANRGETQGDALGLYREKGFAGVSPWNALFATREAYLHTVDWTVNLGQAPFVK